MPPSPVGRDTVRALRRSISAGRGNDIVVGDARADMLLGGEGDGRLACGDGNDSLYGGEGVDVLTGGSGYDVLVDLSSASGDTYRYNLGDGADEVSDHGGTDTVQLGTGIARTATGVRSDFAGRLVRSFAEGTDSLATAGFGEGQIWVLGFFGDDYMRRVVYRAALGSLEAALPARPVPCAPFKMKKKRYELHTKYVGPWTSIRHAHSRTQSIPA